MWQVFPKTPDIIDRVKKIKLFLSDNDGVLTDGCVYYSGQGEQLKKYNMRDGMGFERLRDVAGIEVGIVTKERTDFAVRRAEKLNITEIHTGINNKVQTVTEIAKSKGLDFSEIGFMGDDLNDLEILQMVGLATCPADALPQVLNVCHLVAEHPGGGGAFRCVAEYIIANRIN